MSIRDQIYKNTEYQRGVLTGAAQAYFTACLAMEDVTMFETELMRDIKNALQLQGREHTQADMLALLIVFCNEGYLPQT